MSGVLLLIVVLVSSRLSLVEVFLVLELITALLVSLLVAGMALS